MSKRSNGKDASFRASSSTGRKNGRGSSKSTDTKSSKGPIPTPEPMDRPKTKGKEGEKIQVHTNFFPLRVQNISIYQYSITIEEEEGEGIWTDKAPENFKGFNRNIVKQFARKHLKLKYPMPYDGRSLVFTAEKLPKLPSFEAEVDLEGNAFDEGNDTAGKKSKKIAGNESKNIVGKKSKKIIVSIKKTENEWDSAKKKIHLGNGSISIINLESILTAVDIIIGTGPLKTHTLVGRSFFKEPGPSDKNMDLGGGAFAWSGFYQSARLTENRLVLNMDASKTAFWGYGGNSLLKVAKDNGFLAPGSEEAFVKKMQGIKVKAIHSGITYRFQKLSKKNPEEAEFTFDGKTISVAQYIKEKYGKTLENPNLPCVITNEKKNTLVPLELLEIKKDQRYSKPLTSDQTKNMIRFAEMKPAVRKTATEKAIKFVNHSGDKTCRQFGITVTQNMMMVNARVLPAPKLEYGRISTNRGRGRAETANKGYQRNTQMYESKGIKVWIILYPYKSNQFDKVEQFQKDLVKTSKRMGVNMQEPFGLYSYAENDVEGTLIRTVKTVREKKLGALQLILIVKPTPDGVIYRKIKNLADTKLGVVTQVMLLRQLTKPIHKNLLLKINAKTGGINYVPKPVSDSKVSPEGFANTPHIILGADVTHPAAGGKGPSVAALVGSYDKTNCKFTGVLRNIEGRKEVIEDMGEMFQEIYKRWMAAKPWGNDKPPESIVMFRDGVSEGQFQQVMEHELEGIRRACFDIDKRYNPNITYIIVTKRHHAKFFPSMTNSPSDSNRRPYQDRSNQRGGSSGQRGGRQENIPAGTVIDTDIVSKQYYDFYLNSHKGLMGTNKPAKYTVLFDDNKFEPDMLQAYIYRMAHGYARCETPVSMVRPVFYAHLLAFRGRAYLAEGKEKPKLGAVKVCDDLEKLLYFV